MLLYIIFNLCIWTFCSQNRFPLHLTDRLALPLGDTVLFFMISVATYPSRIIRFLPRTGVKNLTTPFSRNSFCPIVPPIFWVIQPASSYDPFYYTAKLHSKSSKSPIVLIKLHLLMPLGGNFQSFSILSVTSLYWPMEEKEQYDI